MNFYLPELVPRCVGGVGSFIVLAAGVTLGRLIVGYPSSPTTRTADQSRADLFVHWALTVTLGYSLLSWLGVMLDTFDVNSSSVHLSLLCGLASMSVGNALRSLAKQFTSFRTAHRSLQTLIWQRAWLIAFAGLSLAPSLCLPESWDELVYHLELPRRWLAAQSLKIYLDLPYSGFPSLVEINSWMVGALDVKLAPRLVPALFWMISLGLLYANFRLNMERQAAVLLSGAAYLAETILLVGTGGYVEPIMMANLLLMLFFMQRFSVGADWPLWKWAMVLGLLIGGCGATKITGLVVILPACLIWIAHPQIVRGNLGGSGGSYLFRLSLGVNLTLLVAGLFLLPFFVRPWLATGNPLFPYFDHWFTGDLARIESSRFHHDIGGHRFGIRSVIACIGAPLLLAFNGTIYDGSFGYQSLLLFGFIVFRLSSLILYRSYDQQIARLASVSVGLYVAWFFSAQQARFAILAELSMLVLAGRLMFGMNRLQSRFLASASLVAALASIPWTNTNFYVNAWLTNLSLLPNRFALEQGTGAEYLELAAVLNEKTSPDSRILLMLEHRGFYLPRELVIGTPFFQSDIFTPPENYATKESFQQALLEHRITHLVLATRPLGPDLPHSWAERFPVLQQSIEQAAEAGDLRVIWLSEAYQLLEVVSHDRSSSSN